MHQMNSPSSFYYSPPLKVESIVSHTMHGVRWYFPFRLVLWGDWLALYIFTSPHICRVYLPSVGPQRCPSSPVLILSPAAWGNSDFWVWSHMDFDHSLFETSGRKHWPQAWRSHSNGSVGNGVLLHTSSAVCIRIILGVCFAAVV